MSMGWILRFGASRFAGDSLVHRWPSHARGRRALGGRWSYARYQGSRRVSDRVEFGILGSLEVIGADGPVAVRGAKPRALLALLLVRANQLVPSGRLIED